MNKHDGGISGNRAQSSLVAPPERVALRGGTSTTGGGENHLHAITSLQNKIENSLDGVTSVIKLFTFDVYALLEQ